MKEHAKGFYRLVAVKESEKVPLASLHNNCEFSFVSLILRFGELTFN